MTGGFSDAVGRASGAFGLMAFGTARFGVIPTAEALDTIPLIRVYDSSMTWLGQTNLYQLFNPVINFYDVHTFSLSINPGVIDHTLYQPKGFLSYQTPDMPNPYLFIIDSKKLVHSPDGAGSDEMLITGRGIKAILDFRKHMEEFGSGTGFDVQTGVAYETAIRHWINQEVISPTDTARVIPGITWYETDYGRGGTISDVQKRTESVLETCVEQSKTSTLGFDLVWTGSGLNFKIKFYVGIDRSTGTGRVTLSEGIRNVKGSEYLVDSTQEKNVVYVGGTGDGAARALEEVYGGTEPTGWDRRESFLDASDCSTADQLTERGTAFLVDSSQNTSLTFEYNPLSPATIFGRDFTLGDIVNIVLTDVATLTSRIISASWTYDTTGVIVLKLEAGKKKPDWIRIVKHELIKLSAGGKH